MSKYIINGPVTTKIISEMIDESGDRKTSGGLSIFIGQVRADIIDGKRVAAIEYSTYKPMAEREAGKIKSEILSEYDDVQALEIIHSAGVVRAGEISLFVLVCAGHRKQANGACSEIVERLKNRLPVWKKEIFEDDTHHWRENR